MNNQERLKALFNGEKIDRLPVIEWASWWDITTNNWKKEDPSCPLDQQQLFNYFGLDCHYQYWVNLNDGHLPQPEWHGAPLINNETDFESILPHLFSKQSIKNLRKWLICLKSKHDNGEAIVWFSLEGFFWFPRTLFGIENHLYAFYDYPELMHEINTRLVKYYKEVINTIYEILTPDFMSFAEDMSYNHGPMISKNLYNEFMAPYYKQIIPLIKQHGTKVLIDTDGDVEPLIPWFKEVGIDGVLPLERQAGVDVNRIREKYPDWIMMGGYDKTIMCKGEIAMREEFERILPAMKSGKYIPSVDHQTPPDVSLENYKEYVKLLKEYAIKACM
ncbi:uroporphyrinogen decarboxylase family protein [Paludicola sp. MB14-C6]|uniref:uroporphyrinogen decarboxylase family protein n=1 Tax=Paludihabitans sp. MB14-C6 TaxID=3070656 RepID=UPI0027DDCAB0|nr:uroporphyrinogen decarboxylase family protein [Paludicola sp. MB14-C6]WMJ23179.1 uroporphyrinogen decarboxylase family protein [Paludicola sp. MB14-C6]